MNTKIGVYEGYDMYYDSAHKQFLAYDGNDEITDSASQEGLERKLKSMNKKTFKRIPVIDIGGYGYNGKKVMAGEITSINHEDRDIWYVLDGHRRKTGISYCGLSPNTPENRAIAEQVVAKLKEAQRIEVEAKALEETMTKIDHAYLGVSK